MSALSAVTALTVISVVACALTAFFSWRASQLATAIRSTRSLQGELIEIRDYMAKLDAWARRINSRDAMRAHREQKQLSVNGTDGSGDSPATGATFKEQLRRKAGLRAGMPAAHQ